MKPEMPDRFTINSRSFDRSIKRSWACELIGRDGDCLTFVGTFDRTVQHLHLGTIQNGTVSYEYFWLDRWYSVFRFHHPDRSFRNFYCNINMPPEIGDGVLDYVDLDIDLVVEKDGTVRILDEDEFQTNSRIFGYDDETCANVRRAVEELKGLIDERKFPFEILNESQPFAGSDVLSGK